MSLVEASPIATDPALASEFFWTGEVLTRRLVVGGQRHERSRIAVPTGDDLGDWWKAYLTGDAASVHSKPRATVRTVDLFCGSGGFALGFAEACKDLGLGVRSELAVDQDDEAVEVYTANHETRRRCTDSVSTLVDYYVLGEGEQAAFAYPPEMLYEDAHDLVGNVDVVLAGPPCQGHSNLNNKTRRSDRRNELYLAVPAIAIALQAPVVIIENVPAVVHDTRKVVQTATRLLEDAGYTVTGGVLSASKMGWAQTRQRFFLVARKGIAPLDVASVGSALESEPRNVMWAIEGLEDDPRANLGIPEPEYSEENRSRIRWLFDNDQHDLPPSERPDCHKDGTSYGAVYGRMHADRPAPTITTGFMTPGRGRYIHPTRERALRPLEAARIQGFPDDYNFRPDPSEQLSKVKITKWVGDAVPMPLGYGAGIAALGPGWE